MIWLAARVLRRKGKLSGALNTDLELVSRRSMGRRSNLVVVQVGGRTLLVGSTDTQVNLVADLTGSEVTQSEIEAHTIDLVEEPVPLRVVRPSSPPSRPPSRPRRHCSRPSEAVRSGEPETAMTRRRRLLSFIALTCVAFASIMALANGAADAQTVPAPPAAPASPVAPAGPTTTIGGDGKVSLDLDLGSIGDGGTAANGKPSKSIVILLGLTVLAIRAVARDPDDELHPHGRRVGAGPQCQSGCRPFLRTRC